MKLNICRLGRIDYGEALALQERLVELRQQGLIEDTLLLLEHPPVLTLGVRGDEANILAAQEELKANGVGIYRVGRGGDVTYHGPGQIVGYPIIDLTGQGRDIKRFVWNIEEVFIRLLKENFGIKAEREDKKYTGVWVGDEKITAIGIAVKRWVTMHGFAFNVNTNLAHFGWINPCGLADRGVTSLQKLTGREQDFERMNQLVAEYFARIFGAEAETADVAALLRREEAEADA
jgi:lipoyl(octanoyl) transferase